MPGKRYTSVTFKDELYNRLTAKAEEDQISVQCLVSNLLNMSDSEERMRRMIQEELIKVKW